jgi:membrane protein DedA with SNARE-associated domain
MNPRHFAINLAIGAAVWTVLLSALLWIVGWWSA